MNRLLLAFSLVSLWLNLVALPSSAQPNPTLLPARPELRGGSQGEAVRELQAALQLLGFYAGPIDGLYTELTIVAVARFQTAANLPISGIVDRATWNRLLPQAPVTTATPAPATTPSAAPTTTTVATSQPILRLGAEGEAVRRLQTRLQALGFLEGAIDGIFGPATLAAVEAAQADLGLTVDGVVGPATWEVLLTE
ncbi:MAG: peptidoglycan-binding protein [Spirulinaceae cyanobacterium SM2_1_0]|nr:peptidoglycan-binding protein [Spirulinaceae cyanobacterium SM2_1_0]